ncbi:MAG: RIP metalloprotease RseP, partial [Nitrospinota bacterium]|nr:RIP metalloprotease RseP [Nitrospinota bacterium]
RISMIPLGGYVKLMGESLPANDELKENEKEYNSEKMFFSRPVHQRFFVVFAGPFFNIIFAILLSWGLHFFGFPVAGTNVGNVMKGSPAEIAKIKKNDVIIGINQKKISKWSELVRTVIRNPGKELNIKVRRGKKIVALKVTPTLVSPDGSKLQRPMIGIRSGPGSVMMRYGFIESLGKSFSQNITIIQMTVYSLYGMLTRSIPADIGGPIRISVMAKEQANRGLSYLIWFTILLSVNLAILNLLPIPILDGGHIVFLILESLKGKPVSIKTREMLSQIGLFLLISLMIFATYKDSVYYFFGSENKQVKIRKNK